MSVEANYLAAGSEPGINGEYVLLTQRGSEKKLTQVFLKYIDRLFVRPLFLSAPGSPFPLTGQGGVCNHPPWLALPASNRVVAFDEVSVQDGDGLFHRAGQHEVPVSPRFLPSHGKNPMGRSSSDGFLPIIIIPVFDAGLRFVGHNVRFNPAFRRNRSLMAVLVSAFSFIHSAMISLAPASASSAELTPFRY